MGARDVVFITHANPDDNQFARWLTLRLTALGYHAWSDGTELIGGEDFWSDIETVIRQHTAKLVFLLSRASNHRDGCIRELRIANAVRKVEGRSDFVIPVRVDDLAHVETNIELTGLNVIDASTGWAAALKQLTTKLEKDGLSRDPSIGFETVRRWWDVEFGAAEGVTDAPERHFSNWFPLVLPDHIYLHSLIGLMDSQPQWSFPVEMTPSGLVTFASASELTPGLGTLQVRSSQRIETGRFLADPPSDERQARRNIVTHFLSNAWEAFATAQGLRTYDMSGHRRAFYFGQPTLPDWKVYFTGVAGTRAHRSTIGFKTLGTGKRYWHFAISAKPAVHPEPMLAIRAHVLFSDDAVNVWESPDAMHKARRSQCKDWWNDDWRDRLMGTMAWLARESPGLNLLLSPSTLAVVSARPAEFISPVTLKEPSAAGSGSSGGAGRDDVEHDRAEDDETVIAEDDENGHQ